MGNVTLFKIPEVPAGIEETKAQDIKAQFQPMLDKMVELEIEYNQVVGMDITNPETSKLASELLKKYVKVRTGTEAIHKAQKAFYLAGGKYVDSFKNVQSFAAQSIEPKLKEIVQYEEKQLEAHREALRQERWSRLSPYMQSQPDGLGVMDSEIFETFLSGAKSQHEIDTAQSKKDQEEAVKQQIQNNRKSTLALYARVLPQLNDVDISDFTDDEWNEFIIDVEQTYNEAIMNLQKKAVNEDVQKSNNDNFQKEFKVVTNENGAMTATNITVQDALNVWINKSKLYQPDPPPSLTFSDDDRLFIKSVIDKFESFKRWSIAEIEKKYNG